MWLSTKNLNINRPSRKLAERQIGPYTITHIVSPNAVILKLPPSFKINAPINVSRLRPYKPPTILGQHLTPQAPVTFEGEEEYIVEEILDSRLSCILSKQKMWNEFLLNIWDFAVLHASSENQYFLSR